MTELAVLEERIPYHPCMNEHAHSVVARLHLPVAPDCNMHCIYCRRGVGSAGNEQQGPGRAAIILTPQEAVNKTSNFITEFGQEAIVGIAGPGDPLANRQTFETLQLLYSSLPDVRLCLCTNGLCLSDHLAFLKRIRLRHLTVTVNGVDPDIVAQIQPRIVYKGIEYRNRRAAKILIEKQLQGIKGAAALGIFVKVNFVVVDGINDNHVQQTAEAVRQHGAGILNIVPKLTFRNKCFYRPDTHQRIRIFQREASTIMPVFTKCRQCRADAEGIPGKGERYGG